MNKLINAHPEWVVEASSGCEGCKMYLLNLDRDCPYGSRLGNRCKNYIPNWWEDSSDEERTKYNEYNLRLYSLMKKAGHNCCYISPYKEWAEACKRDTSGSIHYLENDNWLVSWREK